MSTPVALWSFTLRYGQENMTHNVNAIARLQRAENKMPAACIAGDLIYIAETQTWAMVKEVRDFNPLDSSQTMLMAAAVPGEFVFVFTEKSRPCLCKVSPAQIEHGDSILIEKSGKKFYATVDAIAYNAGNWVTKPDKRVKK